MNEVRMCKNTWMYCDGKCYKCNGDVTVTDVTYIIEPIFETTPITEELLKMPPADGSTIPKELWKKGDNQLSVNENISLCKLRHGHWVETDTYPKCSVCGLYGVSDMNYCPNCGARMEGEEE